MDTYKAKSISTGKEVTGELAKRMKFKPDNTDPERLKLLKEVRDLQIKTFRIKLLG